MCVEVCSKYNMSATNETGELLENSHLSKFDDSAIKKLGIKCILLFGNLATKYENDKAKDIVQIQAETLCGDAETIQSGLEPDSSCSFERQE